MMVNVLIISIQHWSKLDCREEEPCPVGRAWHTAVCLDYGQDRPQLLMIGGLGGGNKVLGDAWILDVQSGRWKEVRALPDTCVRIPMVLSEQTYMATDYVNERVWSGSRIQLCLGLCMYAWYCIHSNMVDT